MKKIQILDSINGLLYTILFACLIAFMIGAPAWIIVSGLVVIAFIASRKKIQSGVFCAGVYKEFWSDAVFNALTTLLKDTFLDGLQDQSRYVLGGEEGQIIHSSYFGVMPDVLINNNTYPIAIQELNGSDIPIALDKYQTLATPITEDELTALSYDKIKHVKDAHANAMLINRLKKAIHALAPSVDSLKNPVIRTTGAVTEDGTRLRLLWKDIINYRERLSKADIPVEQVRLVLSNEHVNDLLLQDESFQKMYVNRTQGLIPNQLGLELREYSGNPHYNAAGQKLSFGAVAGATDRQASVAFIPSRCAKALGGVYMYYSEAKTDPLMQRNLINFRNYFIAMPAVNEALGAIVSANPSEL